VVVYLRFGKLAGSLYLTAVVVVSSALIMLYFKFLPNSPIGRWLISRKPPAPEPGPYDALTGREGRTLTVLRPVGLVLIGERKYSAVSGGEFIEKDRAVKVLKVEGSRIVVRQTGGKA
jgi:membrane-bound serine protease (ClpP class)